VRSDNEPVFRSKVLRLASKVSDIRQQFAQPHSLWQNVRIERLFGTLKPPLRQLVLTNGSAFAAALFEFQLFDNHVPDTSESWRAPQDRDDNEEPF
jgi:putative transposase